MEFETGWFAELAALILTGIPLYAGATRSRAYAAYSAITLLAVVNEDMRPVSALHMHDLVKAGLALWSSEKE